MHHQSDKTIALLHSKPAFFEPFVLKKLVLPRQARDKHTVGKTHSFRVRCEELRNDLDRVEADLGATGVGEDVAVHVHEEQPLLWRVEEVTVLPPVFVPLRSHRRTTTRGSIRISSQAATLSR
jgi:hypothetical protein